MVDYNSVYLVAGIIIAAAGIIGTNIWNNKSRKERLDEKRRQQQVDVDSVAREKQREEQSLAKEVLRENKALALEVKQNMKDHVDRLIVTLKQDIELSRVQAYNKMDNIASTTAQLKIDLMEHIEQEKEDKVRMQKSIEFLQTLQFGPEAKSTPEYMKGEEESQEHKDEPEKGVFASRKDTTPSEGEQKE